MMRPFGRLFPDKRVFECEGYRRSSATALRAALFDPVMVARPQGRARLMPGRMILQVRLPAIPDLPEKCALPIVTIQARRRNRSVTLIFVEERAHGRHRQE